MPDPDKLLKTVRRATELVRATPGRRGRTVSLDGAEILVVGDLHGNIGNFQRLLNVADLGRQTRRHLVMQELIHGGFHYADGSDKSHQAVDLWCALKCQYPERVHYLPGNHEMSQWTNRLIAKGDLDLNANFRDGVRSAYGRLGDEIYAAYLALFAVLPLALRTANRVFISHSLPSAAALPKLDLSKLEQDGYEESDCEPGGLAYSLVWGRDVSAANAAAFLAAVDADLLITGHVPCEQGFAAPNDRQLILDSLGSPACYCLVPTGMPLTHAELLNRVQTL